LSLHTYGMTNPKKQTQKSKPKKAKARANTGPL